MPDTMQTVIGAFGVGSVVIATALSLASGSRHTPKHENDSCPSTLPRTLQGDKVNAIDGKDISTKKVNKRGDSNPNAVLKCINDKHIRMNEKDRTEAIKIVNEVFSYNLCYCNCDLFTLIFISS